MLLGLTTSHRCYTDLAEISVDDVNDCLHNLAKVSEKNNDPEKQKTIAIQLLKNASALEIKVRGKCDSIHQCVYIQTHLDTRDVTHACPEQEASGLNVCMYQRAPFFCIY
jgi:hypothetical protein